MAVKFQIEWKGLTQFFAGVRSRADRYAPAAGAALFQEGEETITEAKRITPVDEGVLRSSGHVRPPEMDGEIVVVRAGFGGPAGTGEGQTKDVGYAVYVHEDLTAHHPVGQAKFLEVPLNARRAGYGARIAKRMRRILGGR